VINLPPSGSDRIVGPVVVVDELVAYVVNEVVCSVGYGDGLLVGECVRLAVEGGVGLVVGDDVGLAIGSSVGTKVGMYVGLEIGLGVTF